TVVRQLIDLSSFFLQAEDGIRDWSVTGVQTCALPISGGGGGGLLPAGQAGGRPGRREGGPQPLVGPEPQQRPGRVPVRHRQRPRSEERRVGKEGRARWVADE